ncbi:MAG: hypothetical protein MJZ28_01150 [Paludibacteraceae bacterium]|nr:hypothetical protein [Paludibacteraceae bacterium]
MTKLIIYGVGTLARQIYYYNERYCLYEIVAFVDDNPNIPREFLGKPVMSYNEASVRFCDKKSISYIVAIGYVKCNVPRKNVCEKLKRDGYQLANFITSGSNCWPDTKMGHNVIVFDNVFIGIGCELKDGVVISEGSTLSHDITVGEYTFFSDEVTVGGFAEIKNNCFLGLNSTVKSASVIGAYNIVGAGANLLHTTDDFCVTIGNPGVSTKKDTLSVSI